MLLSVLWLVICPLFYCAYENEEGCGWSFLFPILGLALGAQDNGFSFTVTYRLAATFTFMLMVPLQVRLPTPSSTANAASTSTSTRPRRNRGDVCSRLGPLALTTLISRVPRKP